MTATPDLYRSSDRPPPLRFRTHKCSVIILFPLLLAAVGQAGSGEPVKVNRAVPKVSPPTSGLQFSAQPTPQEIFRALVFEEPLVPIGGEPSADENAALAAALLGYAKRSAYSTRPTQLSPRDMPFAQWNGYFVTVTGAGPWRL
jgi:hypothetical protein